MQLQDIKNQCRFDINQTLLLTMLNFVTLKEVGSEESQLAVKN